MILKILCINYTNIILITDYSFFDSTLLFHRKFLHKYCDLLNITYKLLMYEGLNK